VSRAPFKTALSLLALLGQKSQILTELVCSGLAAYYNIALWVLLFNFNVGIDGSVKVVDENADDLMIYPQVCGLKLLAYAALSY
jgi:hypothetical protein